MQNELKLLDLDSMGAYDPSEPGTRASNARNGLWYAIKRAEDAIDRGSPPRIALQLEKLARAIEQRMTDPGLVSFDPAEGRLHPGALGRWRRRLRKRYAASLGEMERLIQQAESGHWPDLLHEASRKELQRLARIEALEDRAHLDAYWTDLGVGD